ncbi:Phosphoglycerate mutase family protein [Rhodotorula toruloides]|nr:Phosphoglycerate mutase family protein [Rhodotorula toruloides]
MPPRVFLLRHGEAQHNVGPPFPPPDHSLLDPELTSRGVTQCAAIPTTYPTFFASLKPENTIILVSPLRRTMQTMLLGFSSLLPSSTSHPVPLLILPQLQECGAYPCDIGGPLEETKARFPHEWLDWSEVEKNPEWNQNRGEFEATEAKNVARARWVRKFIRERKEENVVVVSHHGLLRRIVKAPHAHDRKKSPIQWDNATLREYKFADETGADEEADLVRVPDQVL